MPSMTQPLVLLVGDSVIDNRAYANPSTGNILSKTKTFTVFDHSVEETATCHFDKKIRNVPQMWYGLARIRGYPYQKRSVQLFPNKEFSHIFVSVGGNDVVLDCFSAEILRAIVFGYFTWSLYNPLGSVLLKRILTVLRKYRERYPDSTIWYIKPYYLTLRDVEALLYRHEVNNGFNLHAPTMLKVLNKAIDTVCSGIRSSEFLLLEPDWKDGDSAVSKFNIPEPSQSGAKTLARAIANAVVSN